MTDLTSRQRMKKALERCEVDHVPSCFMSFAILRKRMKDNLYKCCLEELAMGLDPMLFIPMTPRSQRIDHTDLRGLPVRFHSSVRINQWKERDKDCRVSLWKEYATPEGNLLTGVNLTEDWPHGNHIPFLDDFQVSRSLKPLISNPADLNALQFLMQPPSPEDCQVFQKEAIDAGIFADKQGVLLAGGWGVGMDMADWLCGVQNLMFLSFDQPEFVENLLEMIHQWNLKRMEVVLSSPIDLFIRRAWYEGSNFITPRFFNQYILPRLNREVDLAHEQGVSFGYICTNGTLPFLDSYLQSGIDILIGLDPVQGATPNLKLIKDKIGHQICVWGGVSAAVTLEMGSESEIRSAVSQAVEQFGKTGFILSPVDNITIDHPQTWNNIDIFIDEWRKTR